jgi:hypothetical protein
MQNKFDLRVELQELIARRIESYEELEVLLALRRFQGHFCSVPFIAQLTNLSHSSVEEAGSGLCRRGIAETDREQGLAIRYAPADAAEDALVGELAVTYRERKLEVIRVMTAMAFERLRTRGAKTFRSWRDEPSDE